MRIDVAIDSIIPDNTAFTVLTSLHHLGYTELTNVERSEHILLKVLDGTRADEVASELSHAEVIFNPNKHRLSYAAENAPDVEPAQFEALVRDRDENNRPLQDLLVTTFGMTALLGLERAIGWRLYEAKGSAARDRLEWACAALLCNPVSQRFQIRRRPVSLQVGEPAASAAKSGK